MIKECGNCGLAIEPPEDFRGSPELRGCPLNGLVKESDSCGNWEPVFDEEALHL